MTGDTSNYTVPNDINWISTSTSDISTEENENYYWEESDGIRYKIFTSKYLYEKGFCCGNKCRHCPYNKNCDEKNNKTILDKICSKFDCRNRKKD